MSGITCLLDGAHGQYIPQAFVEVYSPEKWGVTDEDRDILLAGPDHEWYWETWDDVLGNATYTDDLGFKWTLYQEGDLLALCDALMTLEEKDNFGFDLHDDLNEILDAHPEFEVKHDGGWWYWVGPESPEPSGRCAIWYGAALDCVKTNSLTK